MSAVASQEEPLSPEGPEGVRLTISMVAARLEISLQAMADHAGLAKTTLSSIVVENRWPKKASAEERQRIRDCLGDLMRQHGATEVQLADLWLPYSKQRRDLNTTPNYQTAPTVLSEARRHNQEIADMLLAKRSLTGEARRHFTLFNNPFDGEVTNDAQLYRNSEIRFIQEAVWQTAQNAGFVAVVGESGAGKTTVVGDLEERIEREHLKLVMFKPSMLGMGRNNETSLRSQDILSAIILTLDPMATVNRTIEARTRQAVKAVTESFKLGNRHLLLLEEGHGLTKDTIKFLKRLHESMRVGRTPALGILVLGQPELKLKLSENSHDVREVVQRLEVVELRPLLGGALKEYLEHRCKVLDRQLSEFIDDKGIDAMRSRLTLQHISGGKARTIAMSYPLAVNNFMTAALNKAAEIGAPKVTADIVMAV